MYDDSVTSWPSSIDADYQASGAFHRHVLSPFLSPSDEPQLNWPPQRRRLQYTYSTYENWFASGLLFMTYIPADEHAAFWTSTEFPLVHLGGWTQKVAFAYLVTILSGGP
jgi:hypothetical protein